MASIRKDYDTLRARYVNDTAESANVGRSQVFVELLASVDDFERARVRCRLGSIHHAARQMGAEEEEGRRRRTHSFGRGSTEGPGRGGG